MTVSSDTARHQSVGNGVTVVFTVPFRILDEAHLQITKLDTVTALETPYVLNSDYTVSDVGEDNTTVTFAVAPISTHKQTYLRNVPITQELDLPETGNLPSTSIEDALDRCIMIVQQLKELVSRSFLAPISTTLTNLIFPAPSATKFLRWNAAADALENADVTLSGGIGIPVSTAQGGTGGVFGSVALMFAGIKQAATTAVSGVGTIATQALALAGVDTTTWITPAQLWSMPFRGGWKNIVGANGGFEVAQRGAGGVAVFAVPASTVAYTLDLYYLATNANQAHTISQQPGLTDGSRFCAQVQRNAGQTGVGGVIFGRPLDSDEVYRLRNKKVSIRFTAKAGANWSPASGNIVCHLFLGTGAIVKRVIGFTNETNPLGVSANLAPGGAAADFSGVSAGVCAANATQGEILFFWVPAGTAGANDYVQIDDLDVRAAESVIDQFERRPFEDELRACMRHYEKTFAYATAPAAGVSGASAAGALLYHVRVAGATITETVNWFFKVPKRIASATVTFFRPVGAGAGWWNITDAANSGGATAAFLVGQDSVAISNAQVAGDGVGEQVIIHATVDAGI